MDTARFNAREILDTFLSRYKLDKYFFSLSETLHKVWHVTLNKIGVV